MKVILYIDSTYDNWYWTLEDDNKHYKYVIKALSSTYVSNSLNELKCRMLLCMAERDGLSDSMKFETEIPKNWHTKECLFNGKLSDWIKGKRIKKIKERLARIDGDFI